MVLFITITTLAHGILFTYDEYILNKRRTLSQAEINSAMVDGLLYLAVVSFTIFSTYSEFLGNIYILLAGLSCVSIIKNEYFYEDISKAERLVHAGLYVLHPLILYAFYISWKMSFFTTNMAYWMLQVCYLVLGFKAVTYHIIYWNYIHERDKR